MSVRSVLPVDLPSFTEVLRIRCAEDPAQETFRFLGDRDGDSETLSNAQADRRARALGALLQRAGPRQCALLLLPPGLDYIASFWGCLYAGCAAVPAYPPSLANAGRAMARLAAIADDARPRFVLAPRALVEARHRIVEANSVLGQADWIAVDALPEGLEDEWKAPDLSRDDLAFLQYTSGSTGRPKGVMISHGNLLHNTEQMRVLLAAGPDDRHAGWLPPYHDMGLVAGILMVSQFGMQVTLMSPFSFLKHPIRWIQTLSDNRSTITGGAPFGFDLAARKIRPEQLQGIDLSNIRVACIAAEPVHPSTIDRFIDVFGPVGFRREAFLPCYGLAESTLMATGGPAAAMPIVRSFGRTALHEGKAEEADASASNRIALLANGPVIDGMELRIVDPETSTPCPPDQTGEIWLSGASIAQGYWGQPEETAKTFGARLAPPHDLGREYLRTGDVGFLREGELFVGGRIKDLVIVDGRNFHPEDLEAVLENAHPNLVPGGSVAFSVDDGEHERAVVVQEVVTRGLDRESACNAIRAIVAETHGLELSAVVLIRARTLPRTSSMKVQRRACRDAFRNGDLIQVHIWRNPRHGAGKRPGVEVAA